MNLGWVAAFVAGVVSVGSPCVLPLVPVYVCHLAGTDFASLPNRAAQRRAVGRTAVFMAGFAAVLVGLGASAGVAGNLLSAYRPFVEKLGGIAVVVFGLQLLGVWNVWPRSGRGGSLGLGMALAICWTPCVGPLLASVLVLAGQAGTAWRGAELLAVYAAGMGLPLLVAAASIGWFMRASRRWRSWAPAAERLGGAVLVAVGLVLYFGAFDRLAALFA